MDEQLNRQVAVEVMGWRFDEDWGCLIPPEQRAKPSEMWTGWEEGVDEDGLPDIYKEPVDENHVPGAVYTHGHKKIRLPDYSGDMGEAWEVVEKIAQDYDCNIAVWRFSGRKNTPPYQGLIGGGDLRYVSPYLSVKVYAESAPLAICLTALKAVRDSKND